MNPIHDNQGNLLAVEMNGSRISAGALAQMAARVAALEAQLLAAQRDNTRLITRIVELEHERDALRPLAAAALSYTDAYEAARTAYLAAMRAGESPMNHSEDSATWAAWERAVEARERALAALRETARGMTP